MDTDTLPAPTSGSDAATEMQSSAPPPPSGASDWADAAKQPAPPTATPGTGTIPQQAAPTYTQPPVVITPQQPKGILGVVASVRDALTGTTRPTIGTDADGNKYVKETTLTHGEQWRKIAGELGSGAAAALAAGKGAGNMGKAALAGVQQGEDIANDQRQQKKDMSAEARQENLDNANNQMVKMQHAEQTFRATRMQVEATQKDIDFSQQQEDRLLKAGGEVLGTMTNPGDITKVLKVNPDVAKDLVQNHTIELVNHYTDGKLDGIKVIKMPADHGSEVLPAGSIFHTFDPIKNELTEHHASDPMTAREQNNYDTVAMTAKNKFDADKKEQDLKDQQAAAAKATAGKAPSEIAKNNAEATEAQGRAAEAFANAHKTNIETVGAGDDPTLTRKRIVDGMLDGSVDITKAVGIFKDPHAREQYIAEAKAIDPNWTMQKYQAMMKLRDSMTSGKLGDQVQSFNTFLGHAAGVDADVSNLRNGGSPLLNRPINWLRTNATNNPIVAGMLPEIDATRGEFQNFISNHALQKNEITRGEKLLSEDQSPAQMQAAIKDFMQVALTRLGSIQNRNAETFGERTPNLISPQNIQHIRDLGLDKYAANYGLMPHAGAAPSGAPPPIPPNTPPPAAGMKRVWAPGMPTWRDVPAGAVKPNVPGQVVQ